jgi:hypothetical protein
MTATVDSACYVFGIVPAGARLPDCNGSGPASELRLVPADDLAAVVGPLPRGRSLGRTSDLLAHDEVLAALVATRTPVLPMRFGAVLPDEQAVTTDLLHEHAAEFRADLDRVRDRVQYTVKVRYREPVVLREILTDRPELERLRDAASFAARLQLGQAIVAELDRRRPGDVSDVLAAIGEFDEVRLGEPAEPDDVLSAAFLVRYGSAAAFEKQIDTLARRRASRMQMRLVGPTAAYDFVGRS